jgi:hypothetical protein
MSFPILDNRLRPLLLTVTLLATPLSLFAAEEVPRSRAPDITVNGINELRLARGYDISESTLDRPWDYLINTMDVTAQAREFYTKLRFDVQEPSMGFNPPEPVFREYLSRRTFGFETAPLTLEAGNISTQFGRGLTLSLKEDRDIERYVILDGVYGRLLYPWVTIQGIAGRPYQWRNRPLALNAADESDRGDTVALIDAADLRMRNNVEGIYVELFDPAEKPLFSFLSSCQVGGGLVRYSSGVGPLRLGYQDTVAIERPFWYQNRETWYLPSASASLSLGEYALSIDQAWMTGKIHNYTNPMDSVHGAFDSSFTTPTAPSTYVSAQAALHGVSLLAEYKNYFYSETVLFSEEVGSFLIPPGVRYINSWHLLNKHMLSNLMGDAIGYKFMLNWSPLESSLLTGDFSFGGRHGHDTHFGITPESAYWEAYGEWSQEAGDRITAKVGIDYGKLDPEQPKVTFRTLACQVNAGPFKQRHSFGLTVESQLNDKPFLAEPSIQSLKDLIVRTVHPDSLLQDTLRFDYLVPDAERSPYTQRAVNLLLTLTYSFSPLLTVGVTMEHEVVLESLDDIHVQTEISSLTNNYASIGLLLKPFPNNTISMEYGSMSGGKKCTLGTCVDLPEYKGFKLLFTSMF